MVFIETVSFPLSKAFKGHGLEESSKSLVGDKRKQKLVRISYPTYEEASLESKDVENIRNLEEFDVESFWYVKFVSNWLHPLQSAFLIHLHAHMSEFSIYFAGSKQITLIIQCHIFDVCVVDCEINSHHDFCSFFKCMCVVDCETHIMIFAPI